MNKVIVVYDDRIKPNSEISKINGKRSFGRTIFKRLEVSEHVRKRSGEPFFVLDTENIDIPRDSAICYMTADFMIKDAEGFDILKKKASYALEDYKVSCDGRTCMYIFHEYQSFIDYLDGKNNPDSVIESEDFYYLGERQNFLDFITGGFDARYFNALEGDYYTVTKQSTNIQKIKREYEFYYLMPKSMQRYFVQPYDYSENEDSASYTMERYHMTDVAIRFVHSAVSEKEMRGLLDQLFHFVKERSTREVSYEEYVAARDSLYVKKVRDRIDELKKLDSFNTIREYIASGTSYKSIDEIFDEYLGLYEKLVKADTKDKDYVLAAGHGDLCFSNILYDKDAHIMKLIDPKGALSVDELYMEPYYDVAKLSHSVCGGYDFFNSDLYQIELNEDVLFNLKIDGDLGEYKNIFKEMLSESGFDYVRVRLYEASLFLSMLPLHMDRPKKVLGFILNAINILKELSNERL